MVGLTEIQMGGWQGFCFSRSMIELRICFMDMQTDLNHICIAMALQKNRKGQKPMDLPVELLQLLLKPSNIDESGENEGES